MAWLPNTKESYMVMLPAARKRVGTSRGIRAFSMSVTIGAASMLFAHSALAGESASDILKKMADVYTKAKSYQVTVTTMQTGKNPQGKPFTVTQTEHIWYQTPNMFHKSVKLAGTGSAPGAEQLKQRQGEIYSDGKTATMYVPSKKMYQKQPVPPTVMLAQLVDLLRLVPSGAREGVTLLPNSATVGGRPVYIIELKPVMPKNLKPEQQKQYTAGVKQFKQFPRFLVDKQNYNLLEYSLSTVAGSAKVDLGSQVFGGNIPANLFAFTPPPGSKEFKAPTPPPGGPGVPGGAPPGVVPGGKPK